MAGHIESSFSVAAWIQEMDRRGALESYFSPPLGIPERQTVMLEGWILGVW